ncbi:cytosine permease [Brachybacterium vulturis]|uniref:Cytosine permease n=1 Tax=Brachybacterium vulturis TaxID=2017484 RepID=A0A291GK32_9MICO|nr:cytosine permease [Brachybacterium vulturis]ATG50430.1 cytosine permease [Brachybacterium vulturis]
MDTTPRQDGGAGRPNPDVPTSGERTGPPTPVLEGRSFDYVPPRERHGSLTSQTQLWFMLNASFLTAATGTLGVLTGLNLAWSIVAIVLGSVFGTFFQAFHGAQGPVMGLPQMIQSRAQFGSRGAAIPLAAAAVVQFGFALFYIQTGANSVASVVEAAPMSLLQVLVGVVALLVALVGYRLVLRAETTVSYLMVATLLFLTVAMIVKLPIGELLGQGNFVLAPFLLQFAASATFQVAIAPVVSDYTRYLPAKMSGKLISASVFVGTLTSAIWIEVLGATLAAYDPMVDTVRAFAVLADSVAPGLAVPVMIVSLLTCLNAVAVALYSGSVAVLSAVDGFRELVSSFALRARTLSIAGVLIIIGSLVVPNSILGSFEIFLALLVYFLIPWTSVNLIDYYVVRKGVLSVSDILDTDGGMYGRWGRAGIVSYAVGFVAMIPFFSTSIWSGPAAEALGGADFSFIVGLVVSGCLYLVLTRHLDRAKELEMVRRAPINTLDALSQGHRRVEEEDQLVS